MRRVFVRINFFLRRLICRFFGHVKRPVSLHSVGLLMCRRCLVVTDQKTVRARVTRGEIEQRMAAYPPERYSFVSCNWKKRKAKFVSPAGKRKFVVI